MCNFVLLDFNTNKKHDIRSTKTFKKIKNMKNKKKIKK